MMDSKSSAWAYDITSYARCLKIRDTTNSITSMEFLDKRLQSIRNRWPNHLKVFDAMDREPS